MSARRTATHLAVGATLLLGASACEKPAPQVTMVSGSRSVHAHARQYCSSGGIQSDTDCAVTGAGKITVLRVDQGETVGVDVDKALTKQAWSVYDLDTRVNVSGFRKDHYWSFPANFTDRPIPGVIRLQVTSLERLPTSETDVPPIKGIWIFQLVQKT